MKYIFRIFLLSFIFQYACAERGNDTYRIATDALERSLTHYRNMYAVLDTLPGLLPRTVERDSLITSDSRWWTSGFFPGTLWYLYEHDGDPHIRRMAENMTARVLNRQFNTRDHDVGFQINCSAGNGLRLTGDSIYHTAMINAAQSLATRFDTIVGCTKSWNRNQWHFPVIIDNMMNLELLCAAADLAGRHDLREMAVSHADRTLLHHFREDGSSYHLVDYDPQTGEPLQKITHQGYSDSSAWARGQAWALYGYAMMYRMTGKPEYLDHAVKVGHFIAAHPRLPEDGIPYWDFDDPAIPDALRDASAGAIMASAFLELSTMTGGKTSKRFRRIAEQQIRTLASPEYMAAEGENCNFILMHSVGAIPRNYEIDVPLTYADYYFVEALLRYLKLFRGEPIR